MPEPPVYPPERFVLDCRGRPLDCRPGQPFGAQVMGILNVTPDSFSDGGLFMEQDAALRRVEEMLEEGAAVIDVGGASSRPRGKVYGAGARALPPEQETARVVPVIAAVAERFPEAILSVDTYHPAVARAARACAAHCSWPMPGIAWR